MGFQHQEEEEDDETDLLLLHKMEPKAQALEIETVSEDQKNVGEKTWEESKKMWEIAAPAILTTVAQFSVGFVTVAFVGHIGEVELAAVSVVQNVLEGFVYGVMGIRTQVMQRVAVRKKQGLACTTSLMPRVLNNINEFYDQSRKLKIKSKTGITFRHALRAMSYNRLDVENFVSENHTTAAYTDTAAAQNDVPEQAQNDTAAAQNDPLATANNGATKKRKRSDAGPSTSKGPGKSNKASKSSNQSNASKTTKPSKAGTKVKGKSKA